MISVTDCIAGVARDVPNHGVDLLLQVCVSDSQTMASDRSETYLKNTITSLFEE